MLEATGQDQTPSAKKKRKKVKVKQKRGQGPGEGEGSEGEAKAESSEQHPGCGCVTLFFAYGDPDRGDLDGIPMAARRVEHIALKVKLWSRLEYLRGHISIRR